jgi:flagellar M-ring protein FliF
VAFLDAINPQTLLERIRPILGNRTRATILGGGAAAATLVALAALWFWGSSYAVLYAGLSGEEGGRAIAELQKLNIPYQITEGGRVIEVPASEVGRARLQLAARGVVKKDGDECAVLDNESLGVSPFVEQVHYVRGIETALSRTVGDVDGVVSAKVTLALPKETSFLSDSPKPSASVLVRLRPGTALTGAQVTGLVGLVASSVSGLARDHVTVVDQSGTVLNPNGDDVAMQAPQQLELTHEINHRYETLITDLLVPVLGRGKFPYFVRCRCRFLAKQGKPRQIWRQPCAEPGRDDPYPRRQRQADRHPWRLVEREARDADRHRAPAAAESGS